MRKHRRLTRWAAMGITCSTLLGAAGTTGTASAVTTVDIHAGPLGVMAEWTSPYSLLLVNMSGGRRTCDLALFDEDGTVLAQATRTLRPGETGMLSYLDDTDIVQVLRGMASCADVMGIDDLYLASLQVRHDSALVATTYGRGTFALGTSVSCPATGLGPGQSLQVLAANVGDITDTLTVEFLSRTGAILDTQMITVDPHDTNVIYFIGAPVVRPVYVAGASGGVWKTTNFVVDAGGMPVVEVDGCVPS